MNRKIINFFQKLFDDGVYKKSLNKETWTIVLTDDVQQEIGLKYPNDFIVNMSNEFVYILKKNKKSDINNWSIPFIEEGPKISVILTHKIK